MINKKKLFRFFPEQRMNTDFPWYIWCSGWILILKGILWLLIDPDAPSVIVGYKHLIYMIPLVICGIGIWNLKKRAVLAALVLCIAEIPFLILYPMDLSFLTFDHISLISKLAYCFSLIINGIFGSILIICFIPVIFKYIKNNND